MLATFQHRRFFTGRRRPGTRAWPTARLRRGVRRGVDEHPAPGVRGADLDGRPDLAREWNVLVLGPHFAGGFVARDLGDEGPDEARRFDFAMTFDRELVSRPRQRS